MYSPCDWGCCSYAPEALLAAGDTKTRHFLCFLLDLNTRRCWVVPACLDGSEITRRSCDTKSAPGNRRGEETAKAKGPRRSAERSDRASPSTRYVSWGRGTGISACLEHGSEVTRRGFLLRSKWVTKRAPWCFYTCGVGGDGVAVSPCPCGLSGSPYVWLDAA
jgi:hypothetical protein